MAGKIDDATQELARLVPHADDADFRVHRSGDFDDIGIALPGMGEGQPVLHSESPIEGHLVFDPGTDAALRVDSVFIGAADGLDDGLLDSLQVLRIGT